MDAAPPGEAALGLDADKAPPPPVASGRIGYLVLKYLSKANDPGSHSLSPRTAFKVSHSGRMYMQ